MAIFIIKPVTEDNGTMVGGNMVFESSETGTNVAQHFAQSTLNATYPEAGITASQLSDSDWADTAPGWRFQLYRISGVGSSGTTTPTINNVTASELVSEFWHSNHSNSVNGNAYSSSVGNYSPNFGNSTFSTTNEIISFDYSANITGAFVPGDVQRTQSNDNGNVYYNGILVTTSYGGSTNEYYTDDTFGSTFQYTNPRTFTSGDFATKVQGTFGGSAFVNHGRSIDISNITNTDSEKLTALLKAIDIKTYRNFKKEL